MENEELAKRRNLVKKIGRFFGWCDSKIFNIHLRLVKGLLDKETQARAQGLIDDKLHFKTIGAFITWLVVFPCHASKYSTRKFKQAIVRIAISAILAFLPMILLLAFIDQVCPSYKDSFKENLLILHVVITALMFLFFVKFGTVLIRIVTSLLILAILMASFAFLLSDAAPETKSVIFIAFEVVVAIFFLLWNFWPKGKKQESAGAGNE